MTQTTGLSIFPGTVAIMQRSGTRFFLERFRAKWIPVRVKKTRQNKESTTRTCHRLHLGTPARREDDDDRALLHPVDEIDDILVGHADTAGRDGLADIFGLVGAVDAVQ